MRAPTEGTTWDSIEVAAVKLGMRPGALRARCRRARARDEGRSAFPWCVAIGPGGVIAMKLGRHWRVSVPEPERARRRAGDGG